MFDQRSQAIYGGDVPAPGDHYHPDRRAQRPIALDAFRRVRELRADTFAAVPWKSKLVSFILIRGTDIVYEKDAPGKRALLASWLPGDVLLMAWPGQWSQDIFTLNLEARVAADRGLQS